MRFGDQQSCNVKKVSWAGVLTFERLDLFEINVDSADQSWCGSEGRLSVVSALMLDLRWCDLLGLVHLVGNVDWLGCLRFDYLQQRKMVGKSFILVCLLYERSERLHNYWKMLLTMLEGISLGSLSSFLVWPDLVDDETCIVAMWWYTFCVCRILAKWLLTVDKG